MFFATHPTFLPDGDKGYNAYQPAALFKNRHRGAVNERSLVRRGQTQSLHLLHEVQDDKYDYTKLTDEQLHQLDAILDAAGAQALPIECGESATKPA
jgi:hypothetical protein